MIELGDFVMHRDGRSNAAVIARVVSLSADSALIEYDRNGTRHHAMPAAASLVPIADAKAALARAIQHGRPLGVVPLTIGYADALAAWIKHLEMESGR